ncbi:STRA6 [Mytilus coruscus]|uniref:STRA6 n=1 Tax=Mytilus coruscus TaxID=42192 RepID=A0A6J8EDX3_MYTCO|nr:STRA6 [Mytilus coruscus]
MNKVPETFLTPLKAILPVFIAKYLFEYFKTVLIDRRHLQDHKVKKNNSEDYQHVLALKNSEYNQKDLRNGYKKEFIPLSPGKRRLRRDKGYAAYVGLIMFELRHRNPLLLAFCDELLTSQKNKSTDISLQAPHENLEYQRSVSDSLKRQKQTFLRNKWYKAFTVVNNPSLRQTNKPKLLRGFSENPDVDITPSFNVSEA